MNLIFYENLQCVNYSGNDLVKSFYDLIVDGFSTDLRDPLLPRQIVKARCGRT